MKNITLIILFSFGALLGKAQKKSNDTIQVKTSAICGECKETIEKALAYEKGVKKANLNVESKIVTVIYNPDKTDADKIRKVISEAGYDADQVKRNPKAYENLKECCKQPE